MIILFIGVFITCSYILIKNFLEYKTINNNTSELISKVVEIPQNSEKEKDIVIDWEEIESINKDIIGWIKIDDTTINYPIMHDKNLYYMNHTYEKKYNRNGSIFTKTSNPFETEETIIYGHNNKNGIMFAGIENFMNEDFFNNHKTFKIYTKSKKYEAQIISIYSIDVTEESKNIKNLTYDECIQYYQNQSKFKVTNLDSTNKIVKISTCSYLNNKTRPTEQRYYLIASLIEIN